MKTSIMANLLDLVDSGYWHPPDWQNWSDCAIRRLTDPPPWLIQLSLAGNPAAAEAVLREGMAACLYADSEDHKSIVLGYIYLRLKKGEIGLPNFLSLAWDVLDGAGNLKGMNANSIFEIYEELKKVQGDSQMPQDLIKKIEFAFLPNAEVACKKLMEVTNLVCLPD